MNPGRVAIRATLTQSVRWAKIKLTGQLDVHSAIGSLAVSGQAGVPIHQIGKKLGMANRVRLVE